MARMHSKKIRHIVFVIVILLSAFLVFGCSGSKGDTGATGPAGAKGDTGPQGPPGPVTKTAESCAVCHGAGTIADIAVAHPDPTAKDVTISVTKLQKTAGGYPMVSFHVALKDGGDPVTDLTFSDASYYFRFYIADLVPAGTATDWGTWPTAYFERWAYEGNSAGSYPPSVAGDFYNNGGGDYTYVFDTAFASATDEAPDYSTSHDQRLMIALEGHDDTSVNAVTNNAVGFLDFSVPASSGVDAETRVSQRLFVTADACKKCHGPRFQNAAHANDYLDTRACVICHSPLGHYGTEMQDDGAYLSAFIHKIHSAMTTGRFDFTDITYPQNIEDCVVCHSNPNDLPLGSGDEINNWKTHPTMKICGSCHTNVNFATGANHPGGVQTNNEYCVACHPASGPGYGKSVTDAHDTTPSATYEPENVPEYDVTLSITPPTNGTYYTAGEAPMVTVTLKDHATGLPVDPALYTTPQDKAGVSGGGLHEAAVYVYGPRAKAVPVLATDTVTDPNFDADTETPTQGHDLFVGSSDPQVKTDNTGFKYKLLPIPEDMKAGTYMVRVRIGDYDYVGSGDYHIESTAFQDIQIGTATVEPKVAGDDCFNCHGYGTAPFHNDRHAVIFDTDQCLSCHDQSGNYAIPLADRVHAVHSANTAGDLYNIEHGGTHRDWADVTYPQDISRCVTCHNSGDTTYKTKPYMMPCAGCHITTTSPADPILNHMRQNGGPY